MELVPSRVALCYQNGIADIVIYYDKLLVVIVSVRKWNNKKVHIGLF